MSERKRMLILVFGLGLAGAALAPPALPQPYGPPGYGPPGYPPPGYQRPPSYPGEYGSRRGPQSTAAQEASVTIRSPEEGETVRAGRLVTLDYRVVPGPRGDHVHVYVDGREVAIVRQLEGTYDVSPLEPGRHELAIKVVNRAHVPIGVESTVSVEAR